MSSTRQTYPCNRGVPGDQPISSGRASRLTPSHLFAVPVLALLVMQVTSEVADAGMVTWQVDQTNSYVRLTIPDQNLNVPGVGTVAVKIRDANSTTVWTDAGGRRATLAGQIVTDYADGSSISFLGGLQNLYALETNSLRPNPASWDPVTTNYTDTTTAPAALGGRARGTLLLTFDLAYFAFRSVKLDLTNTTGQAIPISNGTFAGNTTACGISSGLVDVDGLTVLTFGQPVPDVYHAALDPLVQTNAGGGTITNTGSLDRKLTYTINLPYLAIDLSGTTVTGSIAGLVVAYATLPTPLTLEGRRLGTNIVLSWPTNATGFSLVYATNLPAANWFLASPLPAVSTNRNVVTNAMTGDAVFYRLYKP